jgi:hypothetical protein
MSNAEKLGLAPPTVIRANLDRLFGDDLDSWPAWELETITDAIGLGFDELGRDKVHMLQILAHYPEMFLEDMTFFLYATKVINNEVANFESIPMPSSLEMAYAIKQFCQLTDTNKVELQAAASLIDCVSYLLIEEGYSKPLAPFDFIPESRFTEGQTPTDTEAKKRALELYVKHMESL